LFISLCQLISIGWIVSTLVALGPLGRGVYNSGGTVASILSDLL